MRDTQHARVQAEMFLAAFGVTSLAVEPWAIDRLRDLLEDELAHAGDTLFRVGDPTEYFHLLHDGRVELVRDQSAPWICEGRGVFGLADALADRPRTRTAVALTDIRAMRVHTEPCLELLEDSVTLARATILGMARVVAELEARLGVRAFRGVEAKETGTPRALDAIERITALVRVPLLRGAGVKTLTELASVCDVTFLSRGASLFEPGTTGRVWLVTSGTVAAARREPAVTAELRAGQLVGGAAALTDGLAAWEARATSDACLVSFAVADWLDLLEGRLDVVRATLGWLASRRDELLQELASP